jgi:two-component system sensor histidine kinase MprB
MRQLDESLEHETAQVLNHGGNVDLSASFLDAQVIVLDPQGDVLFPSAGQPVPLHFARGSAMVKLGDRPVNSQLFETVRTGNGTYRVLGTAATFDANYVQTPSTLVVAQSMGPADTTLAHIRLTSLLVGLAGIAVAGIAGFAIGRTGLRPVDDLTEAAEHVAHTGELRPIEVHGKDELSRLATSFNAMLTALTRSREHQRRLVADAGHELRTPLTSMRTNLDLLAQSFASGTSGLPSQDRDELIGDVRAQLEELSVLVADLVELSRDEPQTVVREHFDLADTVRAAIERVRRRAIGVTFEQRLDPWYVYGESASLERAVTNLLDNAAKWSPPDGTVRVDLQDGLLQVADEGPGIAEEDLGHVFERFYRSPEARTMPGSGLGLSIVRQAAENHGGKVAAARAASGGALLGMWLPGASSTNAGPPETIGEAPEPFRPE